MRLIFLIRHAEPVFPGGVRRCCLGRRTDTPLTENGRHQASDYGAAFDFIPAENFFASRLRRAAETAEILLNGRGRAKLLPGVEELDCGEWEGLGFDEISRRFPEIYEARHNDMSIPPPGGESFDSAADRGIKAIMCALSETKGDIAVAAHAGVNRAIMCRCLGLPMRDNRTLDQQYACVNVLGEENGRLKVLCVGRLASDFPDDDEIMALYERHKTPENVRQHCRAVSEKAEELISRLPGGGGGGRLRAAALLHDLCRTERNHAYEAAGCLRENGYPVIAEMIERHHDLGYTGAFGDRELLYLADKLVSGTQSVTISERFARSAEKCRSPEAIAAHERRKAETEKIYDEYLRLCGAENGGQP